jgi:hypothetical protein
MEGKLRLLGTGGFRCRDATVKPRRKGRQVLVLRPVGENEPGLLTYGLTPFFLLAGILHPVSSTEEGRLPADVRPTVRPVSRLPSTNCCTRRRLLLDEFLPLSSPPSMWRSSAPLQERERGGSCRLGNGERWACRKARQRGGVCIF